jgi:predicted dehydrogenase
MSRTAAPKANPAARSAEGSPVTAPRIGLVGAGHIASRYGAVLAAMASAGEVEVAGVADTVPKAAQELAARLGCSAFDRCASLLDAGRLDLAIIATPPDQHAGDVSECLRRPVHVLCEKPLTTDLASLAAIEASLRHSAGRLGMASKYRHLRDVRQARKLLESGAIGQLLELEICFAKRVDMSQRWNSQRPVSGGGVLMDNGPHAVDLARLFLGPVRQVNASHGPSGRSLQVEETVHLLMRNDSSVLARAHLSWAVSSFSENFLVLYGTEGTIEVGWKASRLRPHAGGAEVFGDGFDGPEAMAAQIRNFLQAARGAEPWLMTADDALENVRVIAAAYRALDRDQWLKTAG